MKVRRILLLLLLLSPVLMSNCDEPTAAVAYYSDLSEMTAAGATPDVGFVDAFWAPQYIAEKWLWPIPGEYVADDFYPQLLEYFQRDGQTYALPHNVQTMALVVNVELFEEFGVVPPTELKDYTWDDFRGMAEAMTHPDRGIYGLGLGSGFSNFLPFLFQGGGRLLDESGKRVMLTTPEAEKALTFYTDLYKDGLVYPSSGEWPHYGVYDDIPGAFARGEIAMFQASPSMYDTVLKEMGRDAVAQGRVRVVELPAGPAGKATTGFVRAYGLYSEPNDAALRFLDFATSKESMSYWIGDLDSPPDYIPARRSAIDAWLEVRPDTAAFVAGIDYMHSYQPAIISIDAIAGFDQMAFKVLTDVWQGRISAMEALEILEKEGNVYLETQ